MKLYKPFVIVSFLSILFVPSVVLGLDCQNANTQADMNQCASSDLARETQIINKTYRDLRTKLNPAQQRQFKKVQLAWIKYKDLSCEFEASGVEGGSAHAMIITACLAEETRLRNKELEALNSCQEGDLSCPSW